MSGITIDKAGPRYWQVNYNGVRLDGFNLKRQAVHVADTLRNVENELGRLYELMGGPVTDEHKALTCTVNDAHLQALRTLP